MKILNLTATAIFIVLVFYLLNVGQKLLLPLVIAIALWYLINTLASVFARLSLGGFHFPKPVCLLASLLTFLLLIVALVNFLSGTFDDVLNVVPLYQQNLTTRLESIPFIDLGVFQERGFTQMVIDWIDLPSYAASMAASFASILASGGLILIYMLFLFLEQGKFDSKIASFVNDPDKEHNVWEVVSRIRDDIQKYISIKMFTSSLTGILSYIFLSIADVDFAAVWGLLIFLLNFIPTVGSIIATIFPAMIALAQSEGYSLFVVVLLGIGFLQICIGNILEPRLMGSSFNLSPLVILMNLALWGTIWGIPGMFLCVPFLIIITIILSYFPQTRGIAIILSSDGQVRAPLNSDLTPFSAGDLLTAQQKPNVESAEID